MVLALHASTCAVWEKSKRKKEKKKKERKKDETVNVLQRPSTRSLKAQCATYLGRNEMGSAASRDVLRSVMAADEGLDFVPVASYDGPASSMARMSRFRVHKKFGRLQSAGPNSESK